MADLTKVRTSRTKPTDGALPTYAGRVEALKNWTTGVSARDLLQSGSPVQALASLAGMSVDELMMAVDVAKKYATKQSFLAAYDAHQPDSEASQRSWHTFLVSEGLAIYNRHAAERVVDEAKVAVREFVRIMQLNPDRSSGIEAMRKMRMWVLSRLDAPSKAIDDTDWFRYAPCMYCGVSEGENEIVESQDFILCMCEQCRDDNVDPESPDWQRVADAYKQFATECVHAINKLYGKA